MVIHLSWSLLGVSEESDPMASVDLPTETIARILYAAFLIFGIILLLNMLIALLSNTYSGQRYICPSNAHRRWYIYMWLLDQGTISDSRAHTSPN